MLYSTYTAILDVLFNPFSAIFTAVERQWTRICSYSHYNHSFTQISLYLFVKLVRKMQLCHITEKPQTPLIWRHSHFGKLYPWLFLKEHRHLRLIILHNYFLTWLLMNAYVARCHARPCISCYYTNNNAFVRQRRGLRSIIQLPTRLEKCHKNVIKKKKKNLNSLNTQVKILHNAVDPAPFPPPAAFTFWRLQHVYTSGHINLYIIDGQFSLILSSSPLNYYSHLHTACSPFH